LKALLQRVTHASVSIRNVVVGRIDQGLMVLVCAEPNDTPEVADRLLMKIAKLRIFSDQSGKMNLSLLDIKGGLLLVPQFTLAANTQTGTRPSFTNAAKPDLAKPLFLRLCDRAVSLFEHVGCGEFGADMQVSLTNDGPVTIWLDVNDV
jgi:D-aminoacyl-tRNA deacylase